MTSVVLRHPAVDAVLAAAAELLDMEVTFIGTFDAEGFAFARMHGADLGVADGDRLDRADSFCHRMLAGAPGSTTDAPNDQYYADSPITTGLGVCSYVGVPIRAVDGTVVATLCGVDRGCVPVAPERVAVLRHLADVISAHLAQAPAAARPSADVIIRRTPSGWRVEPPRGAEAEAADLTSAMVLADLLSEESAVARRPTRPTAEPDDESGRLRLLVIQLEHALAARVIVEQAIGVLSERQHRSARDAFDRLRRVARTRGRRVHDLAREVVASASDATIPLPPELAGPR